MNKTTTIHGFEILGILGDSRRVEILQRLMSGPATLSQLGRAMQMYPAKVRYHLKKLETAGLVELVSKREVRGFVEKYYQATSQAYFINRAILPNPNPAGTIYAIGSHDPALEMLAGVLDADEDLPNLVAIPVGSLDGLIALRQGFCQVAGCHLLDPVGGEYNTSYVRHLFPGQPMHVMTLAHRMQGLLVEPENPRNIRELADLARGEITFINRRSGSGTRLWLDQQLGLLGLEPGQIQGYGREVNTHSQVAEAVRAGVADTGLAVYAAARQFELGFIPLFEERFDLVIPEEEFGSRLLLPALDYLQTARFRRTLEELGGYNPKDTGIEIPLK